jgi:hypothetical protein
MPLIKIYNNESDPYGLKSHSIFKSVRSFIFGYAVIPKLHERCLRRHILATSAEAVSFCRTFGDEAWSQQVWKMVFLTTSCSINADDFCELTLNDKQENLEIERERKGRIKSQCKINTKTRAICFSIFGSEEPPPCSGGHVGWVSFNSFPLSNGHLNQLSASP